MAGGEIFEKRAIADRHGSCKITGRKQRGREELEVGTPTTNHGRNRLSGEGPVALPGVTLAQLFLSSFLIFA